MIGASLKTLPDLKNRMDGWETQNGKKVPVFYLDPGPKDPNLNQDFGNLVKELSGFNAIEESSFQVYN